MTTLPELITDPDTLEAGKTIFQWAAKNFSKDLFKWSKGKSEKEWKKFTQGSRWEKAAEKYCGQMVKRHGDLHMFAMETPIPLNDLYTKVNLLHRPSVFSRSGGSKQGSREKLEEMYCDSSSFTTLTFLERVPDIHPYIALL